MPSLLGKLHKREVESRPAFEANNIIEHSRNKALYQRDIKGHTGCVNAVEFSPDEDLIVSGGDDCSVKLWRTASCCLYSDAQPMCSMDELHYSNIFTLQFSHAAERIYSAGNDNRCLVHDVRTRKLISIYKGDAAFYRLSTHPYNDNVFAAASDDGRVCVYDLRETNGAPAAHIQLDGIAYAADYCPTDAYLLAMCSSPEGLSIYDMRNPKRHYARAGVFSKNAISSSWHPAGDAIFCIRSRSSPLYFNLKKSDFIELKDDEYSNLCTIKSNAFVGSDYMITGSDDWNIYVWKVPTNDDDIPQTYYSQAYSVLRGHRSIVNHVRYSAKNNMLVSCGVEKIVKCWNTFEIQCSYRNPPRRIMMPRNRPYRMYFESPPHESIEEDVDTLHQFDAYYQQALNSRHIHSALSSSSSDSDSDVDYEHHLFGIVSDTLLSDVRDNEDMFGDEMLSTSSNDEENCDDSGHQVQSESEEVEVEAV